MKIALMQEPSNYVGRWPIAGMSVMGFELNVFKIRQYTYSQMFPYLCSIPKKICE